MKNSFIKTSAPRMLAIFLFILTSWNANAQMSQTCSCELVYNPIVTFQSPFDQCCYAFVFNTVTVVPPDGQFPGLNECLVSQSDIVNWNISGPGINMGTSTGPNEALRQCFTDGVYTICARRQVVVTNPATGLPEACEISDCTTLTITDCGEEECVCIPEDLGINIGNINVNGCSVYVSGSSEPQDGCWTLQEIEYNWGDSQVSTGVDTWVSARHTYDCNGLYQVTITGIYTNDAGEICESSDTEWVSITGCKECLQGSVPSSDQIDQGLFGQSIGLSPNPVTEVLLITHNLAPDQQANIKITNSAGQLLKEYNQSVANPTLQFSMADLPAGMYHLLLTSEQGERFTKSFIKH
ncbi:T9SS type A sorting domain-containing protein [Lewinella sp. LCG006]|uniref:T9SS type A sorting domain-containing protein n=1 Tax=Lewinella sp. LCG006 TaxID=3231911 RepID=UPI0034615BC7